ncbi:hypothetical protein ACQ4PT_032507 [Festuca glaucescens]
MPAASTEPLPGGEVAADGDAGAGVLGGGGDDDDLRQLPDQALQGTLQRMQRGVDGGIASRLPDGGRIYRLRLLAIHRELERRQAAAALSAPPPPPPSSSSQHLPPRQGEQTEGGRCEPVVHSSCTESSELTFMVTSCLHRSYQIETAACPSTPRPDVHIIKPEPCEDSPLPAPEAADDLETTPLSSDHPFFTIILSRSQVQKRFQLCIPGRFHKHLPKVCTAATLICCGKSWPMSYRGDLKVKKLDADWMDFAVDNQLQVNDACVFELVTGTKEEVVFHMQILRGGLPEEIISKGATADKPMIIVD